MAVAANETNIQVMTSSNGIDWQLATVPSIGHWTSVCHGNGLFVAVGKGGLDSCYAMTSLDGFTWTIQTMPAAYFETVIAMDVGFMAVGSTIQGGPILAMSFAGTNWNTMPLEIDIKPRGACMSENLLVIVGDTNADGESKVGVVVTAMDEFAPTAIPNVPDGNWVSVCSGNGLFVAVSNDGNIMASPDGRTWIEEIPVSKNGLSSVCYANGYFVAVGGNYYDDNTSVIMSRRYDPDGISKQLNDEVLRAKLAEAAETERANSVEKDLELRKINRSELAQVITDMVYSSDETEVEVTITRYNASNKEVSQYVRTLPIVSFEKAGVMTPEAYSEITSLRNDVNSLMQQGGRFIGVSFATFAQLNAYEVPPGVKMGDFTYVLDDETHDNATTRYVYDGTKFNFAFVIEYDPIGLANQSTPGLVKSDSGTTSGRVFVETDGTMSVVGWSTLAQTVDQKIDKIVPSVAGNIPKLDGVGNLVDSGKSTLDFAAISHAAQHSPGGSDPISVEALGAVPSSKIGAPNGVAGLDANGKIPSSQLPSTSSIVVQATAPTDTGTFWINSTNKLLYYYDGSAWVPTSAVYSA